MIGPPLLTPQRADLNDLRTQFAAQRRAFNAQPLLGVTQRVEHLNRLARGLLRFKERLIYAVSEDFGGRSPHETMSAEIMMSLEAIRYTRKRIKKWMKPSRRHVSLLMKTTTAKVVYQPKGVVGIIVPWNYPIYLATGPLIGALAAGNRVMLKLSEFTPRTTETVGAMLTECFDPDHVAVVAGDAGVGAQFSKMSFDHLLFTGSAAVGRHVMRAAAENLTPVTLELGGKSPAIMGPGASLRSAVERICFGKCLNAGQTCVAPDYVLCPRDQQASVVEQFRTRFSQMYPSLRQNSDYTSVVNDQHYQRLQEYLQEARAKGAEVIELNPASEDLSDGTRKMPLFLLLNPSDDMRVMQEEIFGPILPIVAYETLEHAIRYVNSRPRPLAIYYFDQDKDRQAYVLRTTHSGGVCVNDTVLHVASDDLPFGGIGASGMGQYHAHEGFLTFSHAKAVLTRPFFNTGKVLYPPYGRALQRLIYQWFLRA